MQWRSGRSPGQKTFMRSWDLEVLVTHEEPKGEMVKSRVLVTVLCGEERHSWINPGLVNRLFECIAESRTERPISFSLTFGVKGVENARNQSVQHFMSTDCDWLIMVDNDVYPPEHFMRVITEAEDTGKFIVALPCPMMRPAGVMFAVAQKTANHALSAFMNYLPPEWTKIDYAGTGMIAIRRSVFESIKAPWFEFTSTMSDDFNFCRKAHEAGFEVWTHGAFPCDHLHTYSLLDMLRLRNTLGGQ